EETVRPLHGRLESLAADEVREEAQREPPFPEGSGKRASYRQGCCSAFTVCPRISRPTCEFLGQTPGDGAPVAARSSPNRTDALRGAVPLGSRSCDPSRTAALERSALVGGDAGVGSHDDQLPDDHGRREGLPGELHAERGDGGRVETRGEQRPVAA